MGAAGATGVAGAADAADAKSATDAEKAHRGAQGKAVEAPRKKRTWLRVLIVVIVLFALVAGVLGGAFAWDRWYRYDDVADFQGRWYPAGSTTAVEIGSNAITFDADTAYEYTLDTHDKTVTYKLGPLEGKGHYWFADDRSTLVIEDGGAFTAWDTALSDFGRMVAGMNAAVDGETTELPQGDGISVFTREIDPAVVAAKIEAERQAKLAEQEKRAAEEAAAKSEQEASEAAEQEDDGAGEDDASTRAGDAEGKGAAAGEESADEAGGRSDAAGGGANQPEPQDFANESMGIL